jgi:rare lipoprotein A
MKKLRIIIVVACALFSTCTLNDVDYKTVVILQTAVVTASRVNKEENIRIKKYESRNEYLIEYKKIKYSTDTILYIGETVSFYADAFHGKQTSNQEMFDMNDLTCASPSLKGNPYPFNSKLIITNPINHKTVVVRINDNGPYAMNKDGSVVRPLERHPKRLFDLSKAAFAAIADTKQGLLKVNIKLIKPNN